MFLTEQELAIKITELDAIRISKSDLPIWSRAQPNHRKILQKLTPNCSCTNHEDFRILYFVEEGVTKAFCE